MRRQNSGVIQIIVSAGITLIVLGLVWIVVTLPVSALMNSYEEAGTLAGDTDVAGTSAFVQWFIPGIMIVVGVSTAVWGWKKTVEEREFGFPLPD